MIDEVLNPSGRVRPGERLFAQRFGGPPNVRREAAGRLRLESRGNSQAQHQAEEQSVHAKTSVGRRSYQQERRADAGEKK